MLTQEQIEEIRSIAKELIFEDALRDSEYLADIISTYVDSTPIKELPYLLSSDPEMWMHFLDFDPETGLPWEGANDEENGEE